jgi:DNA-binding NarL/FixJ family response regulator
MPTILIVDDHALVRGTIRARLHNYPEFQVCGEAADGAEAVRKATELKPDFIVLDLVMPLMNGFDAASALRALLPTVRIVAFTLYAEALTKSLAPATLFDAVVAKSAGIDKVVECLRSFRDQPQTSPQAAG